MTDLPTRPLGRTGVRVTTLGFGAMELRGAPRGPELSDQEAERILNDVLDAGINFIDTSIDYGRSEERIGRFISHRRGEYFLAAVWRAARPPTGSARITCCRAPRCKTAGSEPGSTSCSTA
ncbi:aldo/keto reductase [Sorangium sp. So ce260]|uniref:aldo/keto reductase n=1 Tax=Sorangium sp. So ce260 TaxID=3133291 RepID=UPI003F6097C5